MIRGRAQLPDFKLAQPFGGVSRARQEATQRHAVGGAEASELRLTVAATGEWARAQGRMGV